MPSLRPARRWIPAAAVIVLSTVLLLLPAPEEARAGGKERLTVPKELVHVDDGDSLDIAWARGTESVRLLGIDTPEVQHLDHDIPYTQPFGEQALGFLQGAMAVARKVELLRSGEKDKYGRTLGYLFLDGHNYSVLAIEARLAYGPSARFGDNGLPREHAACVAAAGRAGPPAFEEPWLYRKRMQAIAAWLKAEGRYPRRPPDEEPGK
jgi:micrococcal nuclease